MNDQLADLPSADAAKRLIDGESGALGSVIGTTLARAVLIGAGLHVAGTPRARLVKESIAASLAIEVFVLGYLWYEKKTA